MPFALVFIGLIMIVAGAKNTYSQLGAQLVNDFTGPKNFTYWLAAIGAVGALGYIQSLKTFSHAFLALIIIAMVLANGNPKTQGGGLFTKLQQFLQNGPATSTALAPTQGAQPATASNGAQIPTAALQTAIQFIA